ncbi:hypothetical protein [Dyadobacter soli]|nr:hypothetical protein [Dyadobacter soli]
MKKKTLLLAIWLTLALTSAQGQKFKEWFRQNKTQREYLKEQIVQLKIYLELTKEGYKIVKKGLATIHQIKNGEFKLHKNRFDSLLIVKSGITSLSRLQHITDLHGNINELCEMMPAKISRCEAIEDQQKRQMLTALKTLYDDCQTLVNGFFAVIRDDQLQMSDDERIQRIEVLDKEFEDNYLFAQSLRRDFLMICKVSADELKAIQNRRALRGIE